MQRYQIYIILMLFNWLGLSICQDINHRPIADRIIHHVTKNQNFMQQLKYFADVNFRGSWGSESFAGQTFADLTEIRVSFYV